ncbi:hypothetical protein BY458DRAFT_518615 [Sporodiniella umbellata]|nr:hypothetical protein BY458DRAFT_518615 [Sporodiniella umbellata]
MCGRFCCANNPYEIADKLYQDNYFNQEILVNDKDYQPSYNVGPSTDIPVVLSKNGQAQLHTMQWGYIPSWVKGAPLQKPINARQDTLEKEKNYFSSSVDSQRCLVVAEGYFEWKKLTNGKKQAYYIKRKDGRLMLFGALYANSAKTYSCVIVTVEASTSMSFVHDRMPAILDEMSIGSWIDCSKPWKSEISSLLNPAFLNPKCSYPVSDAVGSVKNNSPQLILPRDSLKGSIAHFFKPKENNKKRKTA